MPSNRGGMLRRHKRSMLGAAAAAFGIASVSGKRTDTSNMGPPSRQGSMTNRGAGGAMTTQPLPPSPSDNIGASSLAPAITSPTAPTRCNFSCLDTSGWNQVCGTDGVTYTSACDLEETACEQSKALRPDITTIRHEGPCLDDEAAEYVGEKDDNTSLFFSPLSCDFSCLDAPDGLGVGFTSLCGTDGKTYSSICVLDRAACRARKQGESDIEVDYTGPCEQDDEFEEGDLKGSHDDEDSSHVAPPLHLRNPQRDMKHIY